MTGKVFKTIIILIIIFQMTGFTILSDNNIQTGSCLIEEANRCNIDKDIFLITKTAADDAEQNNNEYFNAQNVVPILMYHAIEENPWGIEQLFVRDSEFEKQIKYLADNGYTPILFDDLENYESYRKPVIITFDDGYRDNYDHAYPILKKYNFKAVVFLIANCLDAPEYLTGEQIIEMKDIVSFQSHTLNHYNLNNININTLETECVKSKSKIEELTGMRVNVLSYPYGKYNQAVIDTVSGYYDYAVTTKSGVYDKTNDNYEINRIRIQRSDTLKNFIAKLHANETQ